MNKFAILHSIGGYKKEIIYFPIIYFPIIYEDVESQNIFTYLNFHLNDTEDKFINIVKQQLRLEDSYLDSLRKDFLNFQNNSSKISFVIKDTFTINSTIFYISVNLSGLKGLVFAQPDSFSRRVKSKNKFRRRWIIRDLDLISADSLNIFENELPRIYSIKKEIFNQVYVDKWNKTMVSLLKKAGT
jgi:hypothetical protein